MRPDRLAAALSFVIPGAGLWYLGKRLWAVLNFILAVCVVTVLYGVEPVSEHIHYVILAVAAGSAGLAHGVATAFNKSSQTAEQTADASRS